MRQDVVIVGGGPAGLTAAQLLRKEGLSVAVVHKGVLGGDLPNLPWVDGFPQVGARTRGAQAAATFIRSAEDAGARFVLGEAVALEHYSRSVVVVLDGHRAIQSQAVVLATGRRKKALDADLGRFEGRGLIACTACDAGFYRGQTVVVAGGGMAGALDALQLADHAGRVVLVERGSALGCMEPLAQRVRAHPTIEVRLNAAVTGASGTAALEAVDIRNADGECASLPATGLSVQVGHAPDSAFVLPSVALDADGFVATDARMRADAPRVFAIGDVRTGSPWTVAGAVADARAAVHALIVQFRDS